MFLPPEGEVLVRGVGLCWLLVWNDSENVDLHRHIIYQNDPMAKPDFMVMVPDLHRRRRRRQARRRLPSLPPEPQGQLQNAFYVPKQFRNTSSTNTFPHIILYQHLQIAIIHIGGLTHSTYAKLDFYTKITKNNLSPPSNGSWSFFTQVATF